MLLVAFVGLCSMAQYATLTHNVNHNGQNSLQCQVHWNSGHGGTYQVVAYFTDSNGYFLKGKGYNFTDNQGRLVYASDRALSCNDNASNVSTLWIPNSILFENFQKGRIYYIRLSIVSGGNFIAQCQPLEIYLN